MIFLSTDQAITLGIFLISAFGTLGAYILSGIKTEIKGISGTIKELIGVQTETLLRLQRVEDRQNFCKKCVSSVS